MYSLLLKEKHTCFYFEIVFRRVIIVNVYRAGNVNVSSILGVIEALASLKILLLKTTIKLLFKILNNSYS